MTEPYDPIKEGYWFPAILDHVYDADSVWLWLNLGLRTWVKSSCRLAGIDAPEVRGEERPEGLASTEALKHLLGPNPRLLVKSTGLEKYGRVLAILFLERDGGWLNVNEWLVENGYAEVREY